MADRESVYKVTFEGDTGSLPAAFTAIKAAFKNTAADLQSTADKLTLFSKLASDAKATGAALDQARERVAALQAQVDAARGRGEGIGDELTKSLKIAERQVATTTKELNGQAGQLAKLSATLKSAGVDTSKLASEEARLTAEIARANAAASQQGAKDLLGIKTLGDVEPQIAKLRASFETLRTSGKLSAGEIAAAQVQLNAKIKETRSEVTSLEGSALKIAPSFASAATAAAAFVAPLLGAGAIVGILKSSAEAAHDFHDRLAELSTITDVTDERLKGLGDGARRVASDLGVDLQDTIRSLFELIRGGIPQDNALEALRASATAAKAALTDTATGAKAAGTIFSALNTPVEDLAGQLDKVIAASKIGGPTLKEFADSAGPLLGVAKAAGIGFDDLVATLAVTSDAVGSAGEAIGTLQKIIVSLNTTDARQKLRDLGIEGASLVDIFTALGERNLGLDQVLQLGLASTKSAAGIAALTNNADALVPALERVRGSAGAAATAVEKLLTSPQERARRFSAALEDAEVALGNLFGPGSVIASGATAYLKGVSQAIDVTVKAADAARAGKISYADYVAIVLHLGSAFEEFAKKEGAASEATSAASARVAQAARDTADASAQLGRARTDLASFATDLATLTQAVQQASARDIADLTAQATAQVVALDKSTQAQAATAKSTLEIQTKLADDRFKVLANGEARINAAIESATKAREKLARDQGVSEQKIAADSAAVRLAALGPVLQGYQQHYAALVQLAQAAAAKEQSLSKERISFNESVEQKLRDIRTEGLGDFDRYVQTVKDADEAISKARAAAAQGDTETAKRYTDQAIGLADAVKTAIDQNGVQIVTSLQAQQTKIEIIKKAQDAYNDALSTAGESAKEGAAGFGDAAKDVASKIADLQGQYDTLKKTVAEGLTLKIERDEQSIDAALASIADISKRLEALKATVETPNKVNSNVADVQAEIDNLKKPTESTHTIHVQTDGPAAGSGGGNGVDIPPLFNRGGLVGRRSTASLSPDVVRSVNAMRALAQPVRRYARGGRVLKDARVPGIGDADTVPADLQAGSYVLRKSAVAHYGDDLMRALITGPRQRFAVGGEVAALAKRLLGGDSKAAAKILGGGATGALKGAQVTGGFGADPELAKVINQASDLLTPLISAASTLPRSPTGLQSLADWLSMMLNLIRATRDVNTAQDLLTKLRQNAQGYADAIANARRWHVPATMGADIGSGGLTLTPPDLSGVRSPRAGFAAGGSTGTDTVPALLTPGEYVMSRDVVRKYGLGLFNALNQRLLPKESLQRMLDVRPALRNLGGVIEARLRHPPMPALFAQGGPVAMADAAPATTSGGTRTTGGDIINNISISADVASFADPAYVRRMLVPVLNDIQKRSR